MIEYVFEMNELERWYKSYKNNFQDILEEDKKKLEKLKGYLIDHRELYTSSFLMKKIRQGTKSYIERSEIYEKVVEGIYSCRLARKEGQDVYEYGFKQDNRCYLRKKGNVVDRLYLYLENEMYEVALLNNDLLYPKIKIQGEYVFDKDHFIVHIHRYYGVLNDEKYQWVSPSLAIIYTNLHKYFLIKEKKEIKFIFRQVFLKENEILYSYYLQKNIHIKNTDNEKQLSIDNIMLSISNVVNEKQRKTEYYYLQFLNQSYFVALEYIKRNAYFSYKKAKEIYYQNVYDFICNKIKELDFKVNYVSIQYPCYGNSIEPLLIGFDEINQEDVVSMKESVDLNFEENIEIVHMFHDYLLENSYFNVLPTLMKRLKKDLEKHLNIEVLLFEMDD